MEIAVTGAGIVCPIGSGAHAYWDAILGGRHGFTAIPGGEHLPGSRMWAAVPDSLLDALDLPAEWLRNADRFTQYAVAAAAQALSMGGLPKPPRETAVIVGNTMGGLPLFAQTQMQLIEEPRRVTPKLMALVIPNMAAARVCVAWGLRGRQLAVSTACASSLDAIGLAAQWIERGEVECALAGGVETLLAPVVYASLERAGALSQSRDPHCAARPFDVERDGFAMGDGGGMLLLESVRHAEARGARILARIRGYASMSEAHHLTSPEPSGEYEAEVMRAALSGTGCLVEVVFAHATGTVVGDIAELRAINSVFEDRQPLVTSLRGQLGHSMAAAGVMSVIAGLYGMRDGLVPPTRGTRRVEPEARFEVVLDSPRAARYDAFLVNAFGFGGQNASLVLSR
ncbi:MAG TPA: beta-ketoacyl-[acyl-carrier-protein] synthase family protein [Steroidobacteraceae bacterium]|nr:beta-ketoacyl-[acyl-carrier-protein] synthase family protein [Steroidobacteraceae bacterium]